ncbi:MAG: hypothetical protein WCO56_21685 [Verrucomicrobiota bacterium]
MGLGYLVVEGHGEIEAAVNLVVRLWQDLQLPPLAWAKPIRGKNLHQERGIQKACELVRSKSDVTALLILRDEDDGCPKDLAPLTAAWVGNLRLPFPSAVVLAHREFEAFFLPCLASIAGRKLVGPGAVERPGLLPDTKFTGDPESLRGVKEWLSKNMPAGRSYKPTLDQLPLTRMLDFQVLRHSTPPLPCFGSLERGLKFLAQQIQEKSKKVYPQAPGE